MHWALTCCKSCTVSAQNWYSLTASPAQSTQSTDGISVRTRFNAFGSAWMSETMAIFTIRFAPTSAAAVSPPRGTRGQEKHREGSRERWVCPRARDDHGSVEG